MTHKIINLLTSNKKLEKYIASQKQFDFNKIIQRPKELSQATVSDMKDKNITSNNIKKYGYENWLSWSKGEWGTVFNAFDTRVISSNKIQFSTEDTPPIEVLTKLSKDRFIKNIWIDSRDNAVYQFDFMDGELVREDKIGELEYMEIKKITKHEPKETEWNYAYSFKNFYDSNINKVLDHIINTNK